MRKRRLAILAIGLGVLGGTGLLLRRLPNRASTDRDAHPTGVAHTNAVRTNESPNAVDAPSARLTPMSESPENEAGMLQDGGWVELLDAESEQVLARGHVMLRQIAEAGDEAGGPLTERSQVVSGGGWTGRLDSLHLDDVTGLADGRYRLRFERNGEELPVELTSWSESSEEASVRSVDDELPTVLLEVGGH